MRAFLFNNQHFVNKSPCFRLMYKLVSQLIIFIKIGCVIHFFLSLNVKYFQKLCFRVGWSNEKNLISMYVVLKFGYCCCCIFLYNRFQFSTRIDRIRKIQNVIVTTEERVCDEQWKHQLINKCPMNIACHYQSLSTFIQPIYKETSSHRFRQHLPKRKETQTHQHSYH